MKMTISEISTKNVGNFTTTITVTNTVDEILAEKGFMPREQIRSVTINNAIVNPRTHSLYLPADIIAKLGLPLAGEIEVKTATGVRIARLFERVILTLQGQEAQPDCIELPEGESAIVGLLALEELGLRLDVDNQQLIEVPDRI